MDADEKAVIVFVLGQGRVVGEHILLLELLQDALKERRQLFRLGCLLVAASGALSYAAQVLDVDPAPQPNGKDGDIVSVRLVDRIVGGGQATGVLDGHPLGVVTLVLAIGHDDHGPFADRLGGDHLDAFVHGIVQRRIPAKLGVEKVHNVPRRVLVRRKGQLLALFQVGRVKIDLVRESDNSHPIPGTQLVEQRVGGTHGLLDRLALHAATDIDDQHDRDHRIRVHLHPHLAGWE